MAFVFPRTGEQIKHAAGRRRQQLSERLEAREATLDAFLNDRPSVRSYILRTANGPDFGHRGASPAQLYGPEEIASEERDQIMRLARRIGELEAEIRKIDVLVANLADEQVIDLSESQLYELGFDDLSGLPH